jgi:hypothetical protein
METRTVAMWSAVALACAAALVADRAACSQSPADPTGLEAEAARLLADGRSGFEDRAKLADRLQVALPPVSDPETGGRLALLWVRMARAALAKIPMDAKSQEPYRAFLIRHENEVVYSEPAGEWLLRVETIWGLHDRHRASASAEAIAWEAAENGLPGECEGYSPCELAQLDLLYGEYLRRHPGGEHVEEAARRIGTACDQLQRLLDSAGGQEFFNPVTDCVDLTPKADALAAALRQAHPSASAALASLQALRSRCP